MASGYSTGGWRSIHVTDGEHPYMGTWWGPGLIIGPEYSFTHAAADFIEGLDGGYPASPTVREALATDYVTDAILRSGREERWEKVAH